jgi:hypothetical protein
MVKITEAGKVARSAAIESKTLCRTAALWDFSIDGPFAAKEEGGEVE